MSENQQQVQQAQVQQQGQEGIIEQVPKIDERYGFDPSYLNPPSWFVELRHEHEYMFKGDGKQGRRKIYHKVEYTDFEKQGIQKLLKYVEDQNFQLPANWDDVNTLKMCYSARFDYKECFKKLVSFVKWINDPEMHTISPKSDELLKNGFIYSHGRDKDLRPVIVLNVTRLTMKETPEQLIRSVSIFLDMVKNYMFRPYHIENWVMIIDLGDRGVFSLPISSLKIIIGSMSVNYCATLEKMFIVNPPWIVRKGWGAIEGMLDPETAAKIRMIGTKDIPQISQQIPKSMLENKYGGEQPDLTQDFWPPRDLFQAERNEDRRRAAEVHKIEEIEAQRLSHIPSSTQKQEQPETRLTHIIQQEPEKQQDNHFEAFMAVEHQYQQQLKQNLSSYFKETIYTQEPSHTQEQQEPQEKRILNFESEDLQVETKQLASEIQLFKGNEITIEPILESKKCHVQCEKCTIF